MKWYRVTYKLKMQKGNASAFSDRCGTSLYDALQREIASLERNGWLSEAEILNISLEYDEVRTKHFNDNNLWGPYL